MRNPSDSYGSAEVEPTRVPVGVIRDFIQNGKQGSCGPPVQLPRSPSAIHNYPRDIEGSWPVIWLGPVGSEAGVAPSRQLRQGHRVSSSSAGMKDRIRQRLTAKLDAQ